jgi:hypothetical protein
MEFNWLSKRCFIYILLYTVTLELHDSYLLKRSYITRNLLLCLTLVKKIHNLVNFNTFSLAVFVLDM